MFRTWFRVSINGGSPKKDTKTFLTRVQAHYRPGYRPPSQTLQKCQTWDVNKSGLGLLTGVHCGNLWVRMGVVIRN